MAESGVALSRRAVALPDLLRMAGPIVLGLTLVGSATGPVAADDTPARPPQAAEETPTPEVQGPITEDMITLELIMSDPGLDRKPPTFPLLGRRRGPLSITSRNVRVSPCGI